MIEINILRKRWERYKKRVLTLKFLLLYFIGLFFILLVTFILFITNKMILTGIQRDMKKFEEEIEKESHLIEMLKMHDKECYDLCKKLAFYEDEFKNRILWSDKIGAISKSIPDGMWLSKLSYKKEFASDKKDIFLIIEGYISPFYIKPDKALLYFKNSLKLNGNNSFDTIKLVELKKGKIEDNDVYYFKFEIKLKNERDI